MIRLVIGYWYENQVFQGENWLEYIFDMAIITNDILAICLITI